jgi:hypothetical protein
VNEFLSYKAVSIVALSSAVTIPCKTITVALEQASAIAS